MSGSADCSDKVFEVSTPAAGAGRECHTPAGETSSCSPGEGACPPDIDCVGSWSECAASCDDKVYSVATAQSGQGSSCAAADGDTAPCAPGEGQCPTYAWAAPGFARCQSDCGPNPSVTRSVTCTATVGGETRDAAPGSCNATLMPDAVKACPTLPVGHMCDDGALETMNDQCVATSYTCTGVVPGSCSGTVTDDPDARTNTEFGCGLAGFTWTAEVACSTFNASECTTRPQCVYSTEYACEGKVALVAAVTFDIAIDDTADIAGVADVDGTLNEEAKIERLNESPVATSAKQTLQPILSAAGMECTVDDITILSISAGSLIIDYKVEVPAAVATPQIRQTATAAVADPASVGLPADAAAITVTVVNSDTGAETEIGKGAK